MDDSSPLCWASPSLSSLPSHATLLNPRQGFSYHTPAANFREGYFVPDWPLPCLF